MGAVREVDISRAIAYTQARQHRLEAADRLERLPAALMADCMLSGLTGKALSDALRHHFPNAKRADVYLAVGLALAVLQADLTIGQMELALHRDEGASQ